MPKSVVGWSFFFSTRFVLCMIGFLGFITEYAMRINLSSALVCMVNHTAEEADRNLKTMLPEDPVCPELNKTKAEDGPFMWSKDEQGGLLAAFFYGYILSQIPAGMLAERFGGKTVIFVTMTIAGMCTILCPIMANLGVYWLFAMRVIIGVAEGFFFPAMHMIWSHWAPPMERSILVGKKTTIGVCYSGTQLGNVVALSTSGYICTSLGWEWIFIIYGIACLVWCAAWFLIVSSTPSQNRWISDKEKSYINESLRGQNSDEPSNVPWSSVLTSLPVWAIVVMHFGQNFGNYLPLTELPTWMTEVLKFDEKSNGIWSSLPYIGYFITYVFSGYVADWIRQNGYLNTKNTRKLMMLISMVGQAGFFIGCAFMDCTKQMLGVAMVTLAQGISGIYAGGFLVNHVDIAPRYAGSLFGLTNLFATIPGIVAPYMTSALTPDSTNSEWRNVFLIAAGIILATLIFYLIFADGEVQSWAVVDDTESTEVINNPGQEPPSYESISSVSHQPDPFFTNQSYQNPNYKHDKLIYQSHAEKF